MYMYLYSYTKESYAVIVQVRLSTYVNKSIAHLRCPQTSCRGIAAFRVACVACMHNAK